MSTSAIVPSIGFTTLPDLHTPVPLRLFGSPVVGLATTAEADGDSDDGANAPRASVAEVVPAVGETTRTMWADMHSRSDSEEEAQTPAPQMTLDTLSMQVDPSDAGLGYRGVYDILP